MSLKKKSEYGRYNTEGKRRKRHDIKKLSDAFMKYIDFLGLDKYMPKNIHSTKINPRYKETIFTHGEIGKITRYLMKRDLIYDDEWGRHVVNWRDNGHA